MTRPKAPRDRGFALLIVLWTLALLALVGTMLVGTGRTAARNQKGLMDNAVAEAAAQGGVYHAIFELLQGNWAGDKIPYRLRIGGTTVDIAIEDQADKINPNATTAPVLQALLANLGADPATAATLAKAIIDWRTRSTLSVSGGTKLAQYLAAGLPYRTADRPFNSIDELGSVVGMTPALLARMKPYLSIYQEGDVAQSGPDSIATLALADARLVDQSAGRLGFQSKNHVYRIAIVARTRSGSRYTLETVVRLKANPQPNERAYQILTWNTQGQ